MRTASKKETKWIKRWNTWITEKPTLPGVWATKEGGFLVRGRAKDPTTGRDKEIRKVLQVQDAATALKWLHEEMARVRKGVIALPKPQERFCDYAVSLLKKKSGAKGTIHSALTRERWGDTLVHLIEGTHSVKGFGEFFVDQITYAHIKAWRDAIGDLIDEKKYAPSTCNGWVAILRVIFKHAMYDFELKKNPTEGIEDFDTSTWSTYTDEEPNALTAAETRAFLECLEGLYPQHYAMALLGFVLGLRPSSLRPLRRRGPTPDVLWQEGEILIRRSQTRGKEVMNKTKTGITQRIPLPEEVMKVLRWHVETQLTTPEQEASDLLFPSVRGGFRSPSVLNKPFADVAERVGLGKKFTQRGLRRTFNDLARNAKVESFITMSISGHQTERMKNRYSTASPAEQTEAIGRVIKLVENAPVERGSNSVAGVPPPQGPQLAGPSGMHGGMHEPERGMHQEKTG